MDPYAVLGIPRDASEEDAKAAYRQLAKTCHPDLHPNDPQAERKFKELSAAYDAIRNPQPDPFQPHVHTWHFRSEGFPFGNSPFDDLFANLHGYTRQQRNIDLHHEVRLTLEEAFHGKEIEITLPTARTIKVRVPPGIEDGVSLRVAQAGDHSNNALRPGDLFLLIRIAPHKTLLRAGRNLTAIVPVTAFDVLLGKEIEVIGIDGRALRVAIPANFDTSRKMRLAGQGMPDISGRGDLLIELFVTFPLLTDEQRQLVQRAAESSLGDHRSK